MEKNTYMVHSIGTIRSGGNGFAVEVDEDYRKGLKGLEGFSHIQVVWWGHLTGAAEYRSMLEFDKPYTKGPDKLGVFATRFPVRPNPIELSVAAVAAINEKTGIIRLHWVDAEDGTPVLDIKPYHPSEDRVKSAHVPGWCRHWPDCLEESTDFDWSSEFTFEN